MILCSRQKLKMNFRSSLKTAGNSQWITVFMELLQGKEYKIDERTIESDEFMVKSLIRELAEKFKSEWKDVRQGTSIII